MKTRIFSLLSLIVSMAVLAPIGTPSIVAEIERPLPQALADVSQSATQALTAFDCSTVTEIPKSQCEALVAFYNATDGDNWTDNTGWLMTNMPCSWFRVTCESGNVTQLSLGLNQLSGPIPPGLSNLTALQWLDLSWNQLSGPIPPELGNLTALQWIGLSGNQLTGTIPPELSNLTALAGLNLSVNQLSGPIPPEIGNLTALTSLDLSSNQLSGPIPLDLSNLTALQRLDLSWNQLTGTILPELGNLTALAELNLNVNQLSGPIPPEIGNLTALQGLDLSSNQLSGPIPTWIGNLTTLTWLGLSGNQLSGPIPPELGNLIALHGLGLYGNQLSGSIPPEIGNLTALKYLYLTHNQLSGPIPPELGNLTALAELWLHNNQLSGPIPPELGNLTTLTWLYLLNNQLSGPIPPEIGNLTALTWLDLRGNQLSGPIPPEIGNLTALTWLGLSSNQLSGPIPPEIGNLTALTWLGLSRNQLSGSIPPELGNLTALTWLGLGLNQLSGSIPPELGNLTALQGLDLGGNQLSGPIPPEIGNLTALTSLDLGDSQLSGPIFPWLGNQLSGPIPPELGNLTALRWLLLGGNHLSGHIPPEIGNLTALQQLDLNYNQLSGELPVALTQLLNLELFYFQNTYLCVPPAGPVPEWLSSIPNVQGTGLICNEMDVDIGFRPVPDGYRFDNWGGSFPVSPTPFNPDFRKEDLVQMFGAEATCWKDIGLGCILRYAAVQWQWNANQIMNRGHCDGMAVTSLRFFKDLDTPATFQNGSQSTYDLQRPNMRYHIAYYFVEQMVDPVAPYKDQIRQNPPSIILNQLRVAMEDDAPDPTTLFVRQEKQGGHAITPYAIEYKSNGVYWIRVYDNNHPDDYNRYVIVNTVDETWSYDLGGVSWTGDANTKSLGIVPISKYAERPVCPWCESTQASQVSNASIGQVWLTGAGHLLITDALGRRVGFTGEDFVNEIPGVFEIIVDAGLGIALEPIYTIPLSETYTILLDGQTLTQTETATVMQFGPGYAAWFENIAVGPTTQDRLTIAADGQELAYAPNESREATLSFALDDTTASRKLQIHGADIAAGQVVTLTADIDQGSLKFNNAQANGGQYNVEIHQNGDSGEHRFIHAGVVISATDTHYINYGAWDGADTITLEIDHGSDGIVNETIELNNQVFRIYLPLVLRQF